MEVQVSETQQELDKITYRKTKLIKDLAEQLDLVLHVRSALVPEAFLLSLLKRNSSSFLERRDTAVADAGVSTGHILDQVLGANEISDTPTSGVERLAGGANGQGTLVQLRRQGSNSREGNIEQTVIDLIGQDDQVVLHAQLTNALEFLPREDLANGVVAISVIS